MAENDARRGSGWHWIAGLGVLTCVLAVLVLPMLHAARESARRMSSGNNLKQIGLALHNYHDKYERLPPGGTFREDGLGMLGWPTIIIPYLEASSFYDRVDHTIAWDDPRQVDLFRQVRISGYLDPSVFPVETSEGLPVIHYAANEWLMHRNGGARFKDIPNGDSTLMVADAFGEFRPWGDTVNWRDPTVPLRTSPRQFGGSARDVTLAAFVDGRVASLGPKIDDRVFARLCGPAELLPSPELVERPTGPYSLNALDFWRRLYVSATGGHTKGGHHARFDLSPDGRVLKADFLAFDYDGPGNASWQAEFQTFVFSKPIDHVYVSGKLHADEIQPFLQIPTLKRLTLSAAQVEGDKEAALRPFRNKIDVD